VFGSCNPKQLDRLGCKPGADQELVSEGWELRFVGDSRMVRDATDTYSDLGYEIRLVALDLDNVDEVCGGCRGSLETFKAVYTRKKKA